MHFVDRKTYGNPIEAHLLKIHKEEQPKWLNYKTWLIHKGIPIINKPSSKWTHNDIRNPLTNLFKNNCAYCGNYSDKDNDGEVDHFLPKEIDTKADYIYSWDNYVWACHSCNNKKRSNYPILNPCDNNEIRYIYFHHLDGRYLVFAGAPSDIKDKFLLTEQKTYINGKKFPQRRRTISKQLEKIYLNDIKLYQEIYDIELLIDSTSVDAKLALDNLNNAKSDLREYLENEDFIYLKISIFQDYKKKHPTFVYSYEDFI